ncbi:MAG: hypothetical protein ACPG4T_10750 [Nannocystaceae bacterium]
MPLLSATLWLVLLVEEKTASGSFVVFLVWLCTLLMIAPKCTRWRTPNLAERPGDADVRALGLPPACATLLHEASVARGCKRDADLMQSVWELLARYRQLSVCDRDRLERAGLADEFEGLAKAVQADAECMGRKARKRLYRKVDTHLETVERKLRQLVLLDPFR